MKNNRKEEFDHFEIEPSSEVWKRIEQKLPPANRRRWFIFWLIPLFVIVAGGMLVFKNSVFSEKNNSNVSINERVISADEQSSLMESPGNSGRNSLSDSFNSNGPVSHRENKKPEQVRKNITATYPVKYNETSLSGEEYPVDEFRISDYAKADDKNVITRAEFLRIKKGSVSFPEMNIDDKVKSRNSSGASACVISRWSIYAGAGVTFSGNKDKSLPDNYSGTIENLNSVYYTTGVSFDLSMRVKLSAGISLISMGQKSASGTEVVLNGPPGDPDKTYTFTSPLGNVTGQGNDFDLAFYNNSDSTLFPVSIMSGLSQDSTSSRYVNLRQEFQYLEVPLTITYKAVERRITPFAGIYFSTGFLLRNQIYLNDKRLNYVYEDELSSYVFSAGITAGFDIKCSRKFSVAVNGFYQEGLTSIFKSDNHWKPYASGIWGGVKYRICK